jgi:hypothetical protein
LLPARIAITLNVRNSARTTERVNRNSKACMMIPLIPQDQINERSNSKKTKCERSSAVNMIH